ncbi:MAG: prepilin-type N-terminal cleavage/methylation domain-containing protein [Gemmatimonadota bacterium]|jgi:prepilin-type N-terminal cleavage/methylation domain-containing protein
MRPAGETAWPDWGFTLVEVLVAITVTGIIALLIYGALETAIDTRERVEERTSGLRSRLGWSALVSTAIRGARPAASADDVVFVLEDAVGAPGLPSDRLRFITAGGLPPLTSDVEWRVTIGSTAGEIVLAAQPVGVVAPMRRIVAPLEGVGIGIRVRPADPGAPWQDAWPAESALPGAVELTYWSEEGTADAPVIVTLPR